MPEDWDQRCMPSMPASMLCAYSFPTANIIEGCWLFLLGFWDTLFWFAHISCFWVLCNVFYFPLLSGYFFLDSNLFTFILIHVLVLGPLPSKGCESHLRKDYNCHLHRFFSDLQSANSETLMCHVYFDLNIPIFTDLNDHIICLCLLTMLPDFTHS